MASPPVLHQSLSLPSPAAIDRAQLQGGGFTASGVQRYETTVQDFVRELHDRSTGFARAAQAVNAPLEVTHEHVRAAANAIAGISNRSPRSAWSLAGQVCEYLAAIGTGIASNHLGSPAGIAWFAGSAAAGLLLITVRLAKSPNA